MQWHSTAPGVLAVAHTRIVGYFFVAGMVAGLLAAGMFTVFAHFVPAKTAASYELLACMCVAIAGVFAAAGWWARNASVVRTVLVATWAAVLLIGTVVVGLDEGIHSLAFGFCSVLICVVSVTVSVRAGAWMTVVCLLCAFGLALAERANLVGGAASIATSPVLMRATTLLILVSLSFTVGLMLTRLIASHLREVQARELRYRTLFDQSPAALLVQNAGELIDSNRAAAALLGSAGEANDAQASELERCTLAAILAHAEVLERQPVGRSVPRQELTLPSCPSVADPRVLQVSAVRVDGERGPETLSMIFDNSQRHAAELASRHVQAQLRNLVAASPDCILLAAIPGERVLLANEQFEALTGYACAEIVGHTIADIGIWRDTDARQRFREQINRHGSVSGFASELTGKDGRIKQITMSASAFAFDGQRYVVTLARDVTDNERAQREQQAILATAAVGIAMTSGNRITRVNAACEQIFGYPPGAMEGMHGSELGPPEQASSPVHSALDVALKRDGHVDVERELRRADGGMFWCRVRGRAVDPDQLSTGRMVWVFEDVTERRRMEQALAAAKDAAEAAGQAKSAFLASTSHEIRTPLNGLIGLTRLALAPQADEVECQRYLPQIRDSAESLAEIMGDILDMSKIESGKLEIEQVTFDLHALLRVLHETYSAVAGSRGIACLLDIEDGLPRVVEGDPVRTRQILGNYLTNALKFSDGGAIEIRARPSASQSIVLSVRDTGHGIDEHAQARLFQRFSQAEHSTTRRFGGTGLGLSICRELAELMGGSVGVQSTPGVGSTFWVELPFASARQSAAQPAVSRQPLAGIRVLIAEDNPVNMIIAVTLLQDWAMEVTEVEDGRAAVDAVDSAAARGVPFAVVLMDVQMPRLDGFAATRELRQRYDAVRLPIIALTAGALVAERDAALACGMEVFLTKPINELALEEALIEVVSRRAANVAPLAAYPRVPHVGSPAPHAAPPAALRRQS